MSIIYKTFSTPVYCYVYDRHTNKVLRISEDEYSCLNNPGEMKQAVISKFQKKGYLLDHNVTCIEHPLCNFVDHMQKNRLEFLLLQVTQDCNLRCKYCVYSGNYENRTHSLEEMDFDLAKRSIDFFVERTSEVPEITLGFYGGEPMLRMDLIKQCVSYIKSQVPDKKIRFNMTTNGTLLSVNNARYLYENDFSIMISLDGDEESHNINRIFKANGKGSFEVIMRNLKRIRDEIPEFIGNVSFNTVLNHNTDYSCVKDYFNTNEVVQDATYIFNLVDTDHSVSDISFSEEFITAFKYDYFLTLLLMLGKCDRKLVPTTYHRSIVQLQDFYRLVKESSPLPETCHHNGPCVPGARRLFVSATGKFYPCERVPEAKATQIGDIDHGLNLEKSREILNIGNITSESCKNCWALRICDQCVSKAVRNGEISGEAKLCHCAGSRSDALDKLKVICMLNEEKYEFEEDWQ